MICHHHCQKPYEFLLVLNMMIENPMNSYGFCSQLPVPKLKLQSLRVLITVAVAGARLLRLKPLLPPQVWDPCR